MLLAVVMVLGVAPAARPGESEKPAAERWYKWSISGRPTGYLHIKRSKSGVAASPVVLSVRFVARFRGQLFWQHVQAHCRDDSCLSAVKVVITGTDDDGGRMPSTEVAFHDGKAVLTTAEGRRRAKKAPGKVVYEFTTFEVIRTLPFKKGVVLEFTQVEEGTNVKENHKIAYVGRETVSVGGEKIGLHKFEQTGQGIRPCQYWVNDGHELVRVVMDGRKEFLLSTQEEAAAAFGIADEQERLPGRP